MERVIVSVELEGENKGADLELPAEIPAGRLAELIAGALQWLPGMTYQIMAEPPGRILYQGETLAEAGAWDGARLVLQPAGAVPSSDLGQGTRPPDLSTPIPLSRDGPVTGFRSLGIAIQDEDEGTEKDAPQEAPIAGYMWKQLD